jgi:hypothetical protein
MLFVFVSSTFTNFLPYINYKINYEYISKVLCINKSNPDLKCNGKCHLQKELKKSAEEESQKKALTEKSVEVESLPAEGISFDFNHTYFLISEVRYSIFKTFFISAPVDLSTPPPKA